MVKKRFKLYSLAKYANLEVVMESQYLSAGAHQAKLLAKFEKNKNYIKNQSIALKAVSAFIMLFMPFLSLIIYSDITKELEIFPISLEGTIIVFSSFIGVFYFLLMLYIILFGLFTTSSLMSGNAFKWLQTLPFSKKEIRKLGFMTLFRSQNVMIIMMIISFPIAMLIMTQNILTFFFSLISSFLITMFSMSLLIIIGEKFSHLFSERSKKSNILRVISLLGYFIIAFSTGILLNLGFSVLQLLINTFRLNFPSEGLVILLSLIPIPFAPGFLVGLSLTAGQVPLFFWISTIIGIFIFAFITYLMYLVAIRSLKTISTTEEGYKKIKKTKLKTSKEIVIEVKSLSPVKAYIRKDLIASTKDYQSLIFILMPIVYPLIMLFSLQVPISSNVSSPISIMILWSIIIGVIQFIPLLLVGGLLSIEESGSSILASLPIIPRDQAKAKIILMLTVHSISLILMTVILTLQTQSVIILILLLGSLPLAWTFLLLVFEMKIALFSKMKYRYVLEEVKKRHKILRWISILGAELGLYFMILIIGFSLFVSLGIMNAIIMIVLIGMASLILLIYSFTKMFPKIDQMSFYETGGYLRKQPIIGSIAILLLFIGFPFLGVFLEIFLLLPWIVSLPYASALFVEFFLIEGFLIFLFLYIVPKGLKIPSKNELFKQYTNEIGISKIKPLGRNLLAGFGFFVIFSIVVLVGANLLGEFLFLPEFLFRNPNPYLTGLASLGWFIWIFMLRPGIWEEVAFRGISIPMLLKKYGNFTVIVVSGILFGLAHSFNLILVGLGWASPINVLYQVIYTTFIGFSLGYTFIKTKSLIPCMLYHYLIDTIGLALINTQINNAFVLGLYLICFIGIIPSILNILFLKLISPLWKEKI